MNAFTLTKGDHDRFRKLFKEHEEARDGAFKTKLGKAEVLKQAAVVRGRRRGRQ